MSYSDPFSPPDPAPAITRTVDWVVDTFNELKSKNLTADANVILNSTFMKYLEDKYGAYTDWPFVPGGPAPAIQSNSIYMGVEWHFSSEINKQGIDAKLFKDIRNLVCSIVQVEHKVDLSVTSPDPFGSLQNRAERAIDIIEKRLVSRHGLTSPLGDRKFDQMGINNGCLGGLVLVLTLTCIFMVLINSNV